MQAKIVGGADGSRNGSTTSPADEAHLQRYLAENCFDDTVGRGGLDLPTRELITFAMLAGRGGANNQGHRPRRWQSHRRQHPPQSCSLC
ncbi:carboxymuconolactone decarboxylase family protein [Nocardia pseudovaccinii]|uniref:carboxymuconolactone decarboxylase family protein n=1 Tax=Nocardia pseudovaccinii TaxID=189540 RepID=UPI003D940C53